MEASCYENITPRSLKSRLDAGERPALLDVREPWEFELARIEGSSLSPCPSWRSVSPSWTLTLRSS